MLRSPIVCILWGYHSTGRQVGLAATASALALASASFAGADPAEGDTVECILPDADAPKSGQVVEVSPDGLVVDFGDGTSATLRAWLCSKRAHPASPTVAPVVAGSSAPVAPVTPTATTPLPPPPPPPPPAASAVASPAPAATEQPEKFWSLGGRLGYAFYVRSLNAYAGSQDTSRVFTEEVEHNKFFAMDRQLLASAYAEAWSQRIDLDAGTSTFVGGEETDYEKLGFKYTSRFWQMADDVWLLGLYAYDRASLTEEVDRIIEVRSASYSLRSHALGLAVDWDPARGASEETGAQVSGSFNRIIVGLSVVKFRNEVERTRDDLRTGATESAVRWFESDGVWPVMTVGADRSIVGSAGRFSFGFLGFHGLYVPMNSWQGDSHGWGNMVYEYTGYIDTEIAIHDHVSLGFDVRLVMYDNRFEVEGQDEAFHFKEMRGVGQALLAARY